MLRAVRPRRIALTLWCSFVLAGFTVSSTNCQRPQNTSNQNTSNSSRAREDLPTAAVEHGTPGGAEGYYKETLDALGIASSIKCTATVTDCIENGEPRMSALLTYLGYSDLKPSYLEDTPSADLMKRVGDDLLAAAFFAPKITDVSQSDPHNTDNINVGWRKVIRLRAKPDSDAAKHGIAAGFLLFNKFQGKDANHAVDPFAPRNDHSNESKTTQLILVRAEKGTGTDPVQRPLHFFVFGPVSEDLLHDPKLKLALQASFDAVAPDVQTGLPQPVKDYFVPIACGQCHGGLSINSVGDKEVDFARQKVNFLDTDHWFDRVQDGDDFAFIRTDNKFGVLYDGGPDETTAKFAAAYDVLRRLNTEIKAQNERVESDPSRPTFQLRAITKWLQLHASGDNSHKDVFARALTPLPGAGVPAWDASADPDKQLLPMLNRFCYRCHSSIAYSIFDHNDVACRKTKITGRLDQTPGTDGAMPQDRVLDPAVKATLLALIAKLPSLPSAQCKK